MTEITQNLSLAQARSLIDSYAFDLGRDNAETLLQYWLDLYNASWIRLATIEALYLGRYKAISIEHILNVWLRLGVPNPHFTYEFERLICRKLPKHLSDLCDLTSDATTIAVTHDRQELKQSPAIALNELSAANKVATTQPNTNLKSVSSKADVRSESEMPLFTTMTLSHSNWSDVAERGNMIHQFVPLPDVSSFFNKLKTFGESN